MHGRARKKVSGRLYGTSIFHQYQIVWLSGLFRMIIYDLRAGPSLRVMRISTIPSIIR